ncbi:uncharacterized protein PV09_00264 [Verruconis gallopava]|uniref:Aspartokinase n=1 Tax=Verruconis gallopava TaxID=253628 RepID=A0A0D1Y2U9_9PEZI|nr:uncharacterized protein PV09_00264 [Verruconis gallopava]KIW09366.1 hypothetical protein PV09_00264 [Verruconis gallopava]
MATVQILTSIVNGVSHTVSPGDAIRKHEQEKDLGSKANWVVQKYGGTSIGKAAEDITSIIRYGLTKDRLAVVCSARSSSVKSDGTTTRLLRAAKAAENGELQAANKLVDEIHADHEAAARKTIRNPDLLSAFLSDLVAECVQLKRTLQAVAELREVSVRTEDKIMSLGERLSCIYMTSLLSDRGTEAALVDLSTVINDHKVPSLNEEGAYKALAVALGEEVLKVKDKLPVITGHFGFVPGGLLHAIGRGYTDLAAALVAIGLGARELQIWKEVDGIFSADPRKVPTATLLSSVSPSEAAELTYYGSEVIHPFTMHQVMINSIPIRIKNVLNPSSGGTVIVPEPQGIRDPIRPKLTRGRSSTNLSDIDKRRKPTAVTVKNSIVVLNVHSNRRTRAHGFLANIFSILDKHHLSVDLISSSEVHVSMALHSEQSMVSSDENEELAIKDIRLQGAYDDLSLIGAVDIVSDMAIVSLVGKDLKNMTGIAGKFFSVLGENNINIEMISQGASEINISCVVSERDSARALSTVHTILFDFLE